MLPANTKDEESVSQRSAVKDSPALRDENSSPAFTSPAVIGASAQAPSWENNAEQTSPTQGATPPAVADGAGPRRTDYLGNFISDPERRRALMAGGQPAGDAPVAPAGTAAVTYLPVTKPSAQPQERQTSGLAADAANALPQRQASVTSSTPQAPFHASPPAPQPESVTVQTYDNNNATNGSSSINNNNNTNTQRMGSAYSNFSVPPSQTAGGGGAMPAYPQPSASSSGQDYINVDDIPVRLSTIGRRDRPWHYGLCMCCSDCDSCLESCCCMPCQVSRQCNMFIDHKPHIHWPFCLLITFTDCCTACSLASCLFVGQARRMARERYGVKGTGVGDCCVAYWCRTCALQQVLLEMTVMNDFPGATCYQVEPRDPAATVEMV